MFETKKIDSFFSGEKNLLDEEEKIYISRRTKVVRFFKLFLPCLTALLLGLGVILFDFGSNPDSTVALAEEEKVYFEKFRMNNTVFEITEKDNRLSKLLADVVEETKPNTKIYTLTNPRAQTYDKDKVITLEAQKGEYIQDTQILKLRSQVIADYNKEMKIRTNSVTYDFSKDFGRGREEVVGQGELGYFKSDKFTFDKAKGIATLIGHVYMKKDDKELTSPDKAVMFLNDNKFITTNAIIKRGKDTLKGDNITVFFKDTKHFDISEAYSKGHTEIYTSGKSAYADECKYNALNDTVRLFGHVKIVDPSGYTAIGDEGFFDNQKKVFTLKNNVLVQDKSGYKATARIGTYDLNKKTFTLDKDVVIVKDSSTIKAPRAIYFQTKDEFRLYDGVKISQEDGTVTAKSGVYFIKKNLAELEHNVVITKKGNQVRGDKAISDFTTSKSRLVAKSGGRIYGKLIEGTFKKDSKD